MGSESAAALSPLLSLPLGLFCTLFSFHPAVLLDDFYILKNFSDEGDFSISSDMRISSGNQVENLRAYRNPQTSKILLDYLISSLFSWLWRNNRACGRDFCAQRFDFNKKLYYNIYRRDGKGYISESTSLVNIIKLCNTVLMFIGVPDSLNVHWLACPPAQTRIKILWFSRLPIDLLMVLLVRGSRLFRSSWLRKPFFRYRTIEYLKRIFSYAPLGSTLKIRSSYLNEMKKVSERKNHLFSGLIQVYRQILRVQTGAIYTMRAVDLVL